MKKRKNPHKGSSFDSFLKDTEIYEEVRASAIKQVIAFQLQEEMKKNKLTQQELAKRMGTSRAALKRLFDPTNVSVTLSTLNRAATALGKDLEIKFK